MGITIFGGRVSNLLSDYALAIGFPLTVLNYFLVGWFLDDLDEFYMQSWKGEYHQFL